MAFTLKKKIKISQKLSRKCIDLCTHCVYNVDIIKAELHSLRTKGNTKMKKSEIIKNEIATLEAEYKARIKKEAPISAENYEERWGLFWSNYGREASRKIKSLENQLKTELNREIEIGDGVTLHLYSDAHACTVIAKTKTTITIQEDKATLDPNFKPEWVEGGFAGHCTNQNEQTYTYERNPKGAIHKCHWSERNGCYQTGGDGSMKITRGRREFYDYNF